MSEVDYHGYLSSLVWRRRARAMKRAYPGCEVCGSAWDLDVHHLHYRTLGDESPRDLVVVCHDCHTAIHDDAKRPPDLEAIAANHSASFVEMGLLDGGLRTIGLSAPRLRAPRIRPPRLG